MGIGVALLPLTRLGPMPENSSDGEGSPGEEFEEATTACGGVTATGEQQGEEESTMFAMAMLAKRDMRSKETRRVRTELSFLPERYV